MSAPASSQALRSRARAIVLTAATGALVLGSAASAGWFGVFMLGLAALVAVGMLLDVDLPWGGSVPLGHAVVIAFAELLTSGQYAAVTALGLLAAFPILRHRAGTLMAVTDVAILGASALAGRLVLESTIAAVPALARAASGPEHEVLIRVVVAGAAYLLVDFFVRGRYLPERSHPVTWREALPIDLTFICAAALIAIANHKSGVATSFVAAIPLLVTRFSFQRYAAARLTYQQTTQALSMIPEIAGFSPLGHGERTSVYAHALAIAMGLDPNTADRVATAGRLHHIGHISQHDPTATDTEPDPEELAEVGGEILRETGFLANVANIVEQVQVAPPGHTSIPVAIVRVASAFDEIVGEDVPLARKAAVEVQAQHSWGIERRIAIELASLVERRPELVEEARSAGAPYTAIAAAQAD